jgi:hypothetical protein
VLAKITEHSHQLCWQCLNVVGYDFGRALRPLQARPR